MNTISKYLLVTLGLALLTGINGSCSPGGEDANANGVESAPPPIENQNGLNPPGNGGPNLNSGNISPNENPVAKIDDTKVTVVDTTKVKPAPLTRTLPENSQLTTKMNAEGHVVETRTFTDHPLLSKVEKITRGPDGSTLRVFLKKGGSKIIDEAAVGNFRTATAALLLKAAGVSTETSDPKESRSGKENAERKGTRGENK